MRPKVLFLRVDRDWGEWVLSAEAGWPRGVKSTASAVRKPAWKSGVILPRSGFPPRNRAKESRSRRYAALVIAVRLPAYGGAISRQLAGETVCGVRVWQGGARCAPSEAQDAPVAAHRAGFRLN